MSAIKGIQEDLHKRFLFVVKLNLYFFADPSNPEIVKTLKNAYSYYQDAGANYAKVS